MQKPNLSGRMYHDTVSFLILLILTATGPVQSQTVSQTRLFAADGSQFGSALAGSGTTLAVGDAFWTSAEGSTVGAAYLFTQTSGGWAQQAELTAGDGQPYDLFGSAVAVAGNTLAVGAPFHNGTGGVYLFVQGKTGWSQTQEILPVDGAFGDFFGSAVAMTPTTLAVGAFRKSGKAGVVYVYALTKGKWALQSELAAPAASANFGFSLSLSGASLLIGAPGQSASLGAAYVYTLSAGKWTKQTLLVPADGIGGGQFGYAVALSGSTTAIGSPGTSATYLYQSSGSGTSVKWSQKAELHPFEGASIAGFGAALALSSTTLVVSAVNTDDREAYVFTLQKGAWTSFYEPAPIDDSINSGGFGTTVALVGATVAISRPYVQIQPQSAHGPQGAVYTYAFGTETMPKNGLDGDLYGNTVAGSANAVVVGAPGQNGGQGGVIAYTLKSGSLSQPVMLSAANGQPGDGFGSALAFDGSTLFVAAPYAGNNGQGALYLYTFSGGVWTARSSLSASDGQAGDLFGTSLTLSGNSLAVGAPGHNNGAGATYVFALSAGQWTQQAELTVGSGQSGDGFGSAVSLSGNTLVIGAPYVSTGVALVTGAAYVYTLGGGQWSLFTTLNALDGQPDDQYGTAVAVAAGQIAVGAPFGNAGNGVVYLYAANTTGWASEQELTGGLATRYGDQSGSVLLWNGAALLVTSSSHNDAAGLVTVYTQSGTTWLPTRWLSAGDGQPFDAFGAAIGLAGGSLLIGAPNANLGTGSLYMD